MAWQSVTLRSATVVVVVPAGGSVVVVVDVDVVDVVDVVAGTVVDVVVAGTVVDVVVVATGIVVVVVTGMLQPASQIADGQFFPGYPSNGGMMSSSCVS